MAIVTFWNDNTGKIGQTHSAMAIATHMSIDHNYRILLMSTGYKDTVTRQGFGLDRTTTTQRLFKTGKTSMELESGIEGMAKMVAANRITPDIVPTYTKLIFRDRLEVLSGPKDGSLGYKRIYESCQDIISVANKYYDIIFVDLNHGLEDESTREILNLSDVIILNIEQKPSEIEKVKKLKETMFAQKLLILVNKYDRKSKYTVKNISRELFEKKDILSVPYNTLYAEAVQEGTVVDLFLNPRIRKLTGTEDRNAFFISELKRAEDVIDYKIQEIQMME